MGRIPAQPDDGRIMRRHATAVAVQSEAVLLLGESGVGKTSLALRLIDAGATLIADDQVDITAIQDDTLLVSSPSSLAGVVELYGAGLIRLPYVARAPLRLVVQCEQGCPERYPARRKWIMEGIAIEEITLDPLHVSAPATIRLLLQALQAGQRLPEDWMAESHHPTALWDKR